MLLGMIFRLYSENFVEIKALFPEILRFEFVTLFVKHPVQRAAGAHHPPEEVRGVQLRPAQGQSARPVRRETRPRAVLLVSQPRPALDASRPAALVVLAVRRGGA